jgi:tetratricopeptide (TPR) repeat protein
MRRTICEREPQRPSTRLSTIPGEELSTTAQRRSLDAPKLLSQLRGDLDWIVMKCLEKDRARRYETANGLATDVQRHLNNEPVVACPPSNLYRLQKLVRRNRLAFAAGAGIAAALVIGLAIALWQSVERTRAYTRAVAAEKAAQAEAAKSDQVAEFLKEMLRSVDSSVAMGRDTTLLREILDRTAERIEKDFSNRPEVEADLGHTIGTVYNELYEFKKAEALFRRGLSLRRTLPGNQNRKIAASSMGLAHALWRQGKNAEGEKRVREAFEIQKNLPDAEKLNTANIYNFLGLTVRDQGRTAEAETIFRQGWAVARQSDGQLPALLFSLASMLAHQDRFREAEKVYKEGIAISTNLNLAHQSMAEMHDNLANTLLAQGKGAEALIFMRQGVEMRRKLFGNDSPAVGNLREAEAAQRESLEITRKGLAGKDPEAVGTVAGLAPALADAGRWTEVEPLIRECRALAEEYIAVGQKSFRSQRLRGALGSLGWALRNQAMHGEAEAIFRYALALVDKDDSSYYNRVNDVALALFAQDKLAPAEAMFREALAANSRNPQYDHDLVVLLNNLGDALSGQGRIEEGKGKYAEAQAAERIALAKAAENGDAKAQNSLAWLMATSRDASQRDGKKAVELATKSVAASNRTNPMTLDTLAAAYAEVGQFTNALAVQQEAMALLKNEVEEKDFARRLRFYTLHLPFRDFGYDVLLRHIETLRRHRKFAEAETMLRDALDTIEADSIDKGDPQVASALKDTGTEAQLRSALVDVYNDLGDYAKAEKMMRHVLELRKTIFGEKSLDVAESLHALSWLLLEQGNRTKLAEAEEKAGAAVELKRKLLGDEEVGTAKSLDLLAMVLSRKGDFAEAEDMQREVVRIWEKNKGPAYSSTLSALNNLGVTLLNQDKLAEAEEVLRRCWDGQTNQNRWLAPNDLRVLGNFAAVLNRQGKWPEAETALTNLLALQKQQLSDTHPDVLSRMSQLASVMRDQNKLEESASIRRQILTLSQKSYGSNSLQVLGARAAWAGVLREQHQWHDAEMQLREVIRLTRQLNPDDKQAEANALRDLTGALIHQSKSSEADEAYNEALQIRTTLVSISATNRSNQCRRLRERAEFFARFGRWKEAVADVKGALALKPDDDVISHLLTPLLVQSGDLEAYRQHCRSQLERFKNTDNPSTAYRVAKDCLMLPSSGVDFYVAADLADRAVRLGRRPRDEFCKSLAEYRQGRFPSAAERLEKLLTQERQDIHLEIEARLVLGMVYHHLHRSDEARAAFAQGVALAEKKLPRLDESDLGDDPSNCIWANALIGEARVLLQGSQETAKSRN